MTSAVKNYLGVCDLSGGSDPSSDARPVPGYQNFHSFAFDGNRKGPRPGMLGTAIGTFLKTVRRPFLNITTAEVCGLASRLEPPVAKARAVLASTDPVALDYHAAKRVLHVNSRISVHDPEDPDSPTSQYLRNCAIEGELLFRRIQDARPFVRFFEPDGPRESDSTSTQRRSGAATSNRC